MAIQVTATKNTLADAYTALCAYAALYSTAGTSTAGTELSGGSPAYARKALSWGAASGGVASATAVTFDVPSGATVAGAGFHSAVTAGSYRDGGALTSQAFASQGTYTLTCTYTQS